MTSWCIGMLAGDDPLRLGPAPGAANPVLTRDHVTDIAARFVADPFMIRVDGLWHLFCEVMPAAERRGVIGHATSRDGQAWRYQGIVLREPFHLSYPLVFASEGAHFLVPESHQADGIRLYRADRFPSHWSFVSTLIEGGFADPTIFAFAGAWWMFAGAPARHVVDLHLFHAPRLAGPWRAHPMSPVVRGDPAQARPAGRVVQHRNRLLRFAQDCSARYGASVHAFEIVEIGPTRYRERPAAPAAVLTGSGSGWNALRMHHVDLHELDTGGWLACVDGDAG